MSQKGEKMKILNKIINIFYPQICGICGEKINIRYTCRKCLNIIEYYQEIVVTSANIENNWYDKLYSALKYAGVFKSKMLAYKFHDCKYLGMTFAEIIEQLILKYDIYADVIIAVPISKERLHERGYNQSAIIAKKVAEFTKIKYQEDILIKKKNNLRQSELTLNKRKENVKDAYSIKNIEKIENKKIILIDDIFTTGATLNECAKILKQNGANQVIALTVMYAEFKE